jgi:hypothetical protein
VSPPGEKGADGKDISVITSTINVPSGAWSVATNTLSWSAVIFNSQITKEIVEKGVVKLSLLRGTTWWELPLTEDRETLTQFGVETGQIQLEVVDLHGAAEKPEDQLFKLVLIPSQ